MTADFDLDYALRALAKNPAPARDERQKADWPPPCTASDRRAAGKVRCDALAPEPLPPGLDASTPAWYHWHRKYATVGLATASARTPEADVSLARAVEAAQRLRVFALTQLETYCSRPAARNLIAFWLEVGRIVALDRQPGEESYQYYRWCEECQR